jgi:hypothetical protein
VDISKQVIMEAGTSSMELDFLFINFLAVLTLMLSMFLWETWAVYVRPLFIPRSEIEKLADKLLQQYEDEAEYIAFINEERAWRYFDYFERGKWLRVRKAISKRRPCCELICNPLPTGEGEVHRASALPQRRRSHHKCHRGQCRNR